MTKRCTLLLCLIACACSKGSSGKQNLGGTSTGVTNPPSGQGTGPTVTPTNSQLHLIGRTNTNVPGGVLMSWPGTGMQVRVIGASKITVTMQGQQWGQFNSFAVLVDGKLGQTVTLTDAVNTYPVTVPDSAGHDVTFIKRNEAGIGQVLVASLTTDGHFVEPTYDATRLIEFIGDTLTVAYGVDGPPGNPNCAKAGNVLADPNFENAAESYAVLTAQALGADWSIMAATSRGLTVNLDGSDAPTMADVYTRQNPFDVNSTWAGTPAPNVVVISLGTQDINYWLYHQVPTTVNTSPTNTATAPAVPANPSGFIAAYTAMVRTIRQKNPQASVILTVGPTLSKYQCFNAGAFANGSCGVDASGNPVPSTLSMAESMVQTVVAAVADPKVTFLEFAADSTDISCDYAPSAAGHQKMAQALVPAIKAATGWTGPATLTPSNDTTSKAQSIVSPNPVFTKPDLSGDPNVTGIDPDQYPWCQVCSPALYNTNVAGCTAPIGTSLACQSYCHMITPLLSETPWASEPPASGNHDPVPWAILGEQATPVGRGHYIHSMEHGAVIIAYNCPSGCDAELAVLRDVVAKRPAPANVPNSPGVIMTPDPLLNTGTRFAMMSWTWTYVFDAPVEANMLCFIDQHLYYGRECNPVGQAAACLPLIGTAMSIPAGGG